MFIYFIYKSRVLFINSARSTDWTVEFVDNVLFIVWDFGFTTCGTHAQTELKLTAKFNI